MILLTLTLSLFLAGLLCLAWSRLEGRNPFGAIFIFGAALALLLAAIVTGLIALSVWIISN